MKRRRSARFASVCCLALALTACVGPPAAPPAPPPSVCDASAGTPVPALSANQRREFLRFYAPVILKQAEEPASLPQFAGRDWITNFYFDGDRELRNNRYRWTTRLYRFVFGSEFPEWRIRPTLYTHALEFMDGGRKNLVLVYHVYHAMQIGSIHDWERVELRLVDVGTSPGDGETVHYAVVTRHSKHTVRPMTLVPEAQFLETSDGKHLLVWQALWSIAVDAGENGLPISGSDYMTAELRFVNESGASLLQSLDSDQLAVVDVGDGRQRTFHYVFAPGGRKVASQVMAEALTKTNASGLAARKSAHEKTMRKRVKRIRYELQDTADILPTNWAPSPAAGGCCGSCGSCEPDDACRPEYRSCLGRDWKCEEEKAVLYVIQDPLESETGHVEIPASATPQVFLPIACDVTAQVKERKGYPRKHWFLGTYELGGDDSFTGEALQSAGRGLANGRPDSVRTAAQPGYWFQHDYFLHAGTLFPPKEGRWLSGDWYRGECGGFDGRWVPLFGD